MDEKTELPCGKPTSGVFSPSDCLHSTHRPFPVRLFSRLFSVYCAFPHGIVLVNHILNTSLRAPMAVYPPSSSPLLDGRMSAIRVVSLKPGGLLRRQSPPRKDKSLFVSYFQNGELRRRLTRNDRKFVQGDADRHSFRMGWKKK